jgi:hypothetical protein
MMFLTENTLRIISKYGFDVLIDITENGKEEMNIISNCKIDNFYPELSLSKHAIME